MMKFLDWSKGYQFQFCTRTLRQWARGAIYASCWLLDGDTTGATIRNNNWILILGYGSLGYTLCGLYIIVEKLHQKTIQRTVFSSLLSYSTKKLSRDDTPRVYRLTYRQWYIWIIRFLYIIVLGMWLEVFATCWLYWHLQMSCVICLVIYILFYQHIELDWMGNVLLVGPIFYFP